MSKVVRLKPRETAAASDQAGRALPSWTYADPDFMALERAKVFLPAWHLVGHVNDIPKTGDYLTFEIMGELAVVVRGAKGQIGAFHNVCPHRAARLVDGVAGNCGKRIVCPYHAWTFKLDGELMGVPHEDQYESFSKAEHGLRRIEHGVGGGFIFIRFQDGEESLEDYLEPVMEDFAIYKTEDMLPTRKPGSRLREVNWKNAFDNYVDALHISVAHDGLHGLLGDSYTLTLDRGVYKILSTIDDRPMQHASNRAYAKYLPRVDHLPDDRQRMWTYWKLWPTLAFDVYPDQVDFMQFLPLSPTTCALRESAYALPDDRREMKAARYLNMRINRIVNREDKDLIERVQAGMSSSSYRAGPLGKNEICLRDFAERMRRAIPIAREVDKPRRDALQAALEA